MRDGARSRLLRRLPTGNEPEHITHGGISMLWMLAVILIVLWLLGILSSHTMGGFIHVLLVVAIIMVLVRLIQGRRVI